MATNQAEITKTTILLVDDEPTVIFALKLLMEAAGYRVCDFTEPRQALEFLGTRPGIDLIISDLRMPDLTGLALLTEINALNLGIPFVLMSGHAASPDIAQALALGAVSYLPKPFSVEQLRTTVQNALGQRRAAS